MTGWGSGGVVIVLAMLAGCGPTAQPPAGPAADEGSAGPSKPGRGSSDVDPCADSPPVPRAYDGILRNAKCDQDMFLTMASVAGQLGVECGYCHVSFEGNDKKFVYPTMTDKKRIANWMSMHLMSSLRNKDGSPLRCKSCHVDDDGKPLLKILGDPRDPIKAQEWMSLVMVNKFVKVDGSKLRCNDCHVGNYTEPDWQGKVILRTEQIPPHEVGEQSF